MRFGTLNLKQVLKGSFNKRYVADVFYDRVRRLQDVPCTNVTLTDAATSLVQGTGSITIIYQDDFAQEIAPKDVADLLSPFGTQIVVSVIITAGAGFTERIPLGVYEVAETPEIITTRYLFQGGVVSKGDRITVTLKDLLAGVQRDEFDTPGAPTDLTSVWGEVQRLTGLPLTRTVPDGPISTTVAYQQDKLQAVYDLATVLDATVCMTADGTLSMRPNAWPDPIDTLSSGDDGTLVNVGRGMANDLVYNKIVVRAYGGGNGVLASAEITDGPLRTRNADGSLSPYRTAPYFFTSRYVTTTAQAQQYADLNLPRVSKLRGVSVALTEVFNPLRDLGDVITVQRLGESFIGRVTNIARDGGPTQVTTVAKGGE